MKSRRSVVVVDEFYSDAHAIRRHALGLSYYTPYEDDEAVRSGRAVPTWWASTFRAFDDCPFKSSRPLVDALEDAIGERIEMAHWMAPFPVDAASKPLRARTSSGPTSCLWNCCFHVKPDNGQQLGDGVHNHVTDNWNSVGRDGWAGIIYLDPMAPTDGGLYLWRNVDAAKNFDWMTPSENWELIDAFGNVFNRLILVRGDVPHSGAAGWGNRLDDGRMYQTFFFRTAPRTTMWPVSLSEIGV